MSTYRIQFHKDFTFADAEQWIEYFEALGIRTLYASPVFSAVPGSMHGYDVINPFEINPEIGTEQQLRRLIGKLQQHGIGWIQDIVPNHMAYHTDNPWLVDVLEKGALSVYATFFDAAWSSDIHAARPMVPFLGTSIQEAIDQNQLSLVSHKNRICLKYGELFFPLNPGSYGALIGTTDLADTLATFHEQLEGLHQITEPVQYALRWHEMLLQFASLQHDPTIGAQLQEALRQASVDKRRLKEIADSQFYRLCDWRETDERINYRRFFLVNGLICLNMQNERVFGMYHEQLAAYVKEGLFQGIRVDHIDGLLDPVTYLQRLRELCGPSCYIVVEKILEHGEELDSRWPIQGTTGYDFLSAVNNLFTRSSAENQFSRFYRLITRDDHSISARILEKKKYILDHHMQGELNNLVTYFTEFLLDNEHPLSVEADSSNGRFSVAMIRESIALILVELPVYRYYGNTLPLEDGERSSVERLLSRCVAKRNDLTPVLSFIAENILGGRTGSQHWLYFYQRCMQFTGPLMAKGVEDTLMYTFNRFVAHNEVGDSPEFFGLETNDFHDLMRVRQKRWPLAMNATATHDTKRGEDVRTRLNVLPDLASAWIGKVKDWMEMNVGLKEEIGPDQNDEYFIYQNLMGVYAHVDGGDLAARMKAFMAKATREAKQHSSWSDPNEAYESAVNNFLDRILLPDGAFMKSFVPFSRLVSDFGMINSLSQLVLKVTCPGVPDIYQGTADWDLSLVDPDNRRPVAFDKQHRLVALDSAFIELWPLRDQGGIKAWTLRKLLHIRSRYERIFNEGQYIPLEVDGRRAEHCMAFARQLEGTWIIVAIPLNAARFMPSAEEWAQHWGDTAIVLPPHAPQQGRKLFSDEPVAHSGRLKLSEIFKDHPASVLYLQELARPRAAGIVLAISSLPGRFGVGDMGPEARKFADFLQLSRQQVWQLLPINPSRSSVGYSPYSAYSAMAGSLMYISPDDLMDDGLLNDKSISVIANTGSADYASAYAGKSALLKDAYQNFINGAFSDMKKEFSTFVKQEKHWLEDFALFEVLRALNANLPWHQWPKSYRDRDPEALAHVIRENGHDLNCHRWTQFIFYRQWHRLRQYCHQRNIRLLGDLPFYVDHDSVDVWAHRHLFAVDSDGLLSHVAGVPPDYFSADGQLWGMPVYDWDAMRRDDFKWFVSRLEHNLALFDWLRLDHFRAFASYWEVPSGERTARRGAWREGPGMKLFEAFQKNRSSRANVFIAEDLGDITPDVYQLRDDLRLPGMHVLQFAFGENAENSIHIPHHHRVNGVVYTGTHDNNTSRGWFRKELDAAARTRLSRYAGKKVTASNVAEVMIALAYGSVARMAIVPLQDILGLNERYRYNIPSTVNRVNWRWRLSQVPDEDDALRLCELTRTFGR